MVQYCCTDLILPSAGCNAVLSNPEAVLNPPVKESINSLSGRAARNDSMGKKPVLAPVVSLIMLIY